MAARHYAGARQRGERGGAVQLRKMRGWVQSPGDVRSCVRDTISFLSGPERAIGGIGSGSSLPGRRVLARSFASERGEGCAGAEGCGPPGVPDEDCSPVAAAAAAIEPATELPLSEAIRVRPAGDGRANGDVSEARMRARAACTAWTAAWKAESQRARSALSSAASVQTIGGRCCLRLRRNANSGLGSAAPSSLSSTINVVSIGSCAGRISEERTRASR